MRERRSPASAKPSPRSRRTADAVTAGANIPIGTRTANGTPSARSPIQADHARPKARVTKRPAPRQSTALALDGDTRLLGVLTRSLGRQRHRARRLRLE